VCVCGGGGGGETLLVQRAPPSHFLSNKRKGEKRDSREALYPMDSHAPCTTWSSLSHGGARKCIPSSLLRALFIITIVFLNPLLPSSCCRPLDGAVLLAFPRRYTRTSSGLLRQQRPGSSPEKRAALLQRSGCNANDIDKLTCTQTHIYTYNTKEKMT
jgi:hypothetical protein